MGYWKARKKDQSKKGNENYDFGADLGSKIGEGEAFDCGWENVNGNRSLSQKPKKTGSLSHSCHAHDKL